MRFIGLPPRRVAVATGCRAFQPMPHPPELSPPSQPAAMSPSPPCPLAVACSRLRGRRSTSRPCSVKASVAFPRRCQRGAARDSPGLPFPEACHHPATEVATSEHPDPLGPSRAPHEGSLERAASLPGDTPPVRRLGVRVRPNCSDDAALRALNPTGLPAVRRAPTPRCALGLTTEFILLATVCSRAEARS